jgi:hypothetical protein
MGNLLRGILRVEAGRLDGLNGSQGHFVVLADDAVMAPGRAFSIGAEVYTVRGAKL